MANPIAVEKAPETKETKYAWQKRHPEAKKVKVIFEENTEIPPTGLFIGINDEQFFVVAGEEVEVPDFLLKHMDNAVMGVPVFNPQTQQVIGYRNKTRFPYRVVEREA